MRRPTGPKLDAAFLDAVTAEARACDADAAQVTGLKAQRLADAATEFGAEREAGRRRLRRLDAAPS